MKSYLVYSVNYKRVKFHKNEYRDNNEYIHRYPKIGKYYIKINLDMRLIFCNKDININNDTTNNYYSLEDLPTELNEYIKVARIK